MLGKRAQILATDSHGRGVILGQTIMKGLLQRLRKADKKIKSLALVDVYGRVARAFMELGHVSKGGGCVTPRRVSWQDVAKMVGASRQWPHGK